MDNLEQIARKIDERFKAAAQTFYKETHGIIDLAHGTDGITQTAARGFLPEAEPALREHGIFRSTPSFAEILVEAFVRKLEPEQQNYVLSHKPDYVQGLETALNTPPVEQKKRAFEIFSL